MNLSHVWFLYISPLSLYLTPTYYVSLCEGEDGESRSVPSRSEDAQRRTGSFWVPALKLIATRFRCAMNRSRLDRVCWIIFCVRPPLIEKGIIKEIIAEEKKKKVHRRLAELKLAPRQQWTIIYKLIVDIIRFVALC